MTFTLLFLNCGGIHDHGSNSVGGGGGGINPAILQSRLSCLYPVFKLQRHWLRDDGVSVGSEDDAVFNNSFSEVSDFAICRNFDFSDKSAVLKASDATILHTGVAEPMLPAPTGVKLMVFDMMGSSKRGISDRAFVSAVKQIKVLQETMTMNGNHRQCIIIYPSSVRNPARAPVQFPKSSVKMVPVVHFAFSARPVCMEPFEHDKS